VDQPALQRGGGDIAGTAQSTVLSTRLLRVGDKVIIDGEDAFQQITAVPDIHKKSHHNAAFGFWQSAFA
jgi:hypothetical protein